MLVYSIVMYNLFPLFIPLAPLITALLSAIPDSKLGDSKYKVGWWIMLLGFATSLLVLLHAIQTPEPTHIILCTLPSKIVPVVELIIDRLSAVMMVIILGLSTVLYGYSMRYMQQDTGLAHYQTIFALKASCLLFMVSSSNLVMIFICWQLSSWFLSLLAHNYAHIPTAHGSFRTFIMLRAGDMAFVLGIILAYHLYGSVELAQLFERAATAQMHIPLFGGIFKITGTTAVTLLIFIAVMSKSAQFPLHMWLPDSLYAPTPIHALLHSGGINAGGFLLTRLAPLYILSSTTLHVVLVIGLATTILGTCMMLVQNDIKKTLGYSTIGQMGYMIMECGLGAFSLAVFHLIAHGLFKADIFLNCGKGIHEARLDPYKPPQSSSQSSLGVIGWIVALLLSFLIPLAITIGVHNILGISFMNSQGLLILLLFSWITASQAMITLFRLKKSLLTKGSMLIVISLVATAYFFAAEQFTHFLIPDPTVVEAYYKAAELPYNLFIGLAIFLILLITGSWFFLLNLQQKDKSQTLSGEFKHNAYLFFMNRLYLDGIAMRFLGILKRIGKVIDKSPVALIFIAGLSLVIAFIQTEQLSTLPLKTVTLFMLFALLLPLFPLHGVYVTALTQAPRMLAIVLCFSLPVLGVCGITWLLPEIPKGFLPAISVLAIVGALWGSVKALLQVRVTYLLSYGGLALYSLVWWHIAQAGKVTSNTLLFAIALTLVWNGLFLAWDRVRIRYGNLDLNQIGGLFKPMPRFSICMGLLIMAAVGLPPFSLFFGFLGILLSPSTGISFGSMVVIATWFAACWYLFKLMQRLLFGPHRSDLKYEDLRPIEFTAFIFLTALLLCTSGISPNWLNAAITEVAMNIEGASWIQ